MTETYLEGEEEALDEQEVAELADWAVEVQGRHVESVRKAGLELAKEEVAA